MSRWFIRFQPLGGSSQRYLDKTTGRTISRRRFLRYQGRCPEMYATERRAAGLSHPRKTRCDKGQPRISHADIALVTAQGWVVLHPLPATPHAFVVVHHKVAVAVIARLPHGQWERWRCATCALTLRSQAAIVAHVVAVHFATVCQAQGVAAPAVTPIRFVPARERHTSLPTRVGTQENAGPWDPILSFTLWVLLTRWCGGMR